MASPSVLIIAPTRELAIQIQNSLVTFAQPMGIKTTCIYGGVAKWEQKNALVEKGGVGKKENNN
jgi:ATP-dependent RNA helicase DBP3